MSGPESGEGAPAQLEHRVSAGLQGAMPFGPSDLGLEIIQLLRSSEPISSEVRARLADAIERGLFGNRTEEPNEFGQVMPWLEIGMGRDGRVGAAIATRRKWFDAAEELERRRAAGETGYDVLTKVGLEFGLRADAVKCANTFRRSFLEELRTPGNRLVAAVLNASGANEFDPNPSPDGPSGGDHYFEARSLFIEREAAAACK